MLESIENPPGAFCSELSRQAGEDLFGTATQSGVYFLLEYNGVWGPKAFESSQVAEEVKAHLTAAQQAAAGAKLLLIRSRSGLLEAGVSFYVAQVSERNPALHAFQLERYEDLLTIDLAAVLVGDPQYTGNRREKPLFLVCTNGRRDPCCAKFGYPVYLELQKEELGEVWQCTHVGGHRFAANLLCFPHGILYGRLEPGRAGETVAAYRQGQLDLDHYRGRSCYASATQAAEYFLRRETGRLGLDDFHLLEDGPTAEGAWEAVFIASPSGLTHRVKLGSETHGERVYETCHLDKMTVRTKWERK